MGVRGLEKFVRTKVPNGCPVVNIRNEIRNCESDSTPATLVIDFRALFEPLCNPDLGGILCGGRYELVYQLLERFLSRLRQLEATLVFFNDGPVKNSRKLASWAENQNQKYDKELRIIDAVDNGDDVRTLAKRFRWDIPNNTQYPVKILAKRYGEFRVSLTGDMKKEMVAYANSVNALAIVTNNTDLLILGGGWRFWSSKDLNFENLTTREFSRSALRSHLGLEDSGKLALFATLGSSNGFLQSEELESFATRYLVNYETKFYDLADFVKRPHENLLEEIFGAMADEGDLRERFQESLDYYETEYLEQEQPLLEDPTLEFLKNHGKAFLHKMWIGFPIHFAPVFIDFRDDGFGSEYPNLSRKIILREAAVVVYHRRDQPEHTSRKLIHRTSHEEGYAERTYELEFPQHVEPPTLQEMLSTDPETQKNLAATKLKLYCWIISDSLDPRQLDAIPPKLMPTVATIYFLVEHQVVEPFEADLLLQVAYEVVFKKYDLINIRYPQYLDGRAFRVAFLYNAISKHVLKALNVVGLNAQEYPVYPQFDGVRFHNLYRKWARGERDLEQIQQWRIYENAF
uniref:Constitutive coactivator of peroxisome proliferator-activated receptor gamma n=1 Tax=Culex pipiens TaxID=7175 RepID=A0A8D8ETF2_CULPI